MLEIPEQAVILVRDQRLRRHPDHPTAGALLGLVLGPGRDDDDIVAQTGPDRHLLVDVGAHAAAGERVEFGDVDQLQPASPSTGCLTGPTCSKPWRYWSVRRARLRPGAIVIHALDAGGLE